MSHINSGDRFGPGSLELDTRYGRLVIPDTKRDLIGRFLARYGEWAWLEATFVASVIADGARVLDIGAFAGTFGLGLAQLHSLGFLCFVEANPDIAPLLERNATRASCPSVVLQALVASSESDARVGHSDPANLGSMSFGKVRKGAASTPLQAITLTGLRARYGTFDLIKLDIEGMEMEALTGDADFLAKDQTTLWLEANEDPRTLEVAQLLLSWNMELFYFAFPAFNPKNFNGHPEAIFPFAFEAGLLAAPKTPPSLSSELKHAGCILKPVRCIDDLRTALWRTPRWGYAEWQDAAGIQELAALAGRSIRGERFADFLASGTAATPGVGPANPIADGMRRVMNRLRQVLRRHAALRRLAARVPGLMFIVRVVLDGGNRAGDRL